MSIRKRLLIWLLSALVLAGTVGAMTIYRRTLSGVNKMQDYALQQIAYSMEYANKLVPQNFEEDSESDGDDDKGENGRDEDGFEFVGQMWDRQGRLILSSNAAAPLPRFGVEGFTTVAWHERKWRIFGVKFKAKFIQVGQPVSVRSNTAAEIAENALFPMAILIPVLGVLIWIGVSYGLRPLKQVASDLETRNADSMQPISLHGLPQEMEFMVSALNKLLERLSNAFELQKNFIADAAHQLRTPLTALHLQAEIVSRSEHREAISEAITHLKQGISRSSHLVEQLLTLARHQPDEKRFEEVDLDDLSKRVICEIAPLAEAKGIDLGLESGGSVLVDGNREALKVLLVNLVDNAIRYIPEAGKIDVRVASRESLAILEVQDNGPGIPEQERERVFDRFYRGMGNNVMGSGLGLSIVRNIVAMHRASISLLNAPGETGLLVHIEFPGADASATRHRP